MKTPHSRRLGIFALIAIALMLFHTASLAIGPTYSGSWYNPEQDGHGFSLEYSKLNDGTPIVVAYWYVYDNEGNQIYLIGTGEPEKNDTVTLQFTATHGMKFGEFNPEQTVREDGGTGAFSFWNDESGVFDYQPSDWMVQNYGLSEISIPVVKLLGVAHPTSEPPPSGEPVPLVGLWSGRMIYDRDYESTITCFDANVLLNVLHSNVGNPDFVHELTIGIDGGSTSSYIINAHITNNYVTGRFEVFGRWGDFTIRFNDYGQAEGTWRMWNYDDKCYGEWKFTKD